MDFSLWVWVLISLGTVVARKNPRFLRLNQGQIRGKRLTTRGGRTIYGYLGIPYAKPPVGELRFKPPEWPMKWKGVRDGTKEKPPCVQKNLRNYKERNITFGNEDCLYLNVFAPRVSKNIRLPVMVYFHGGGFFSGSSTRNNYGPDYILDFDVVLVVINYRLGPLGFLSTEDEHLPGNYGLKDQREALGWIQRNIPSFGGNRLAVTIFGNGAGGASTHLHMLSLRSRYLFHGAISQSGSGLCQWAFNPPGYSKNAAHRVAKEFGCPTNDSEAMAECLRKVRAKDITSVAYTKLEFDVDPTALFVPTIEYHSMDPFITKDPWKIKTVIPWMIGIVSQEGAMKVSSLTRAKDGDARVDKVNREYKHFLSTSLKLDKHAKNATDTANKLQMYYFGHDKIIKGKLGDLIDMYTDSRYTYCISEAVKRHNGPVYQYYFSYKGNKSMASLYGNDKDDLGVCHGDELIYLFPMNSIFPNRTDTKEDIAASKRFVELWTNFAYYKQPTPTRNERNSFTFWRPNSESLKVFLNISNGGYKLSKNNMSDRIHFWQRLHFRNKIRV